MSKSHVTPLMHYGQRGEEGLLTLVSWKAALNRGLSETFNIAFPDIIPVMRPEVQLLENIDPFWLTGFVDAEGCFSVVLFKSKTSKFGEAIKLSFILTQSARDINLTFLIFFYYLIKKITGLGQASPVLGRRVRSFIKYFKCGYVSLENRETIDFKITKFSPSVQNQRPWPWVEGWNKRYCYSFFPSPNAFWPECIRGGEKYPLQGNKSLDFQDFIEVVKLVDNKDHLTLDGLNKIIRLVANFLNYYNNSKN